jgi:hypothetical protein
VKARAVPRARGYLTNNLNTTGKRANFINIQSSSVVGTKECDVYRVGTGYERVVAHLTRPPFAYTSTGEGKITRIDEPSKMVEVSYKDGKTVCFNYGTTVASNSGGGFYLDQPMVLNQIKLNQKIKKGDVLAYNEQFFQRDPYSGQVDYKLGVMAYVALVDTDQTFEDSSIISKTLSDKLRFAPISIREVVVTSNTTVHQCVGLGEHVKNVDPLIVFDESVAPGASEVGSKELAALLQTLNRATPKAHYTGEVVKIDAFYKCQMSEMSASLAKIIKTAQKDKTAKSTFAKDADNHYDYMPTSPLVTEKVGMVNMNRDTVVLRFYIQHEVPVYAGSKIIISSSLKSVAGKVLSDDMHTEDGTIRVDAMLSFRSMLARIVNSPQLCGVAASIIEKMEKDVLEMVFED